MRTTKDTICTYIPTSFCKVIFSKNHFLIQEPHKDPNLQRKFSFSQVFFKENSMSIHIISIHRFNWKKTLVVVKSHLKLSGSSLRFTLINLRTKPIQDSHLSHVKRLLNRIFKGVWDNTSDSVTSLVLTMLYKFGYWNANGVSPSQTSFQNRVLVLAPTTKEPRWKKSSFTPIRRVSMWVWLAFARVFCCCHTSSLDKSLNSHLLSKQLFLSSSTSIPRPPWSLGRQIMFHFVKRYFFFRSSLYQKKRDL
jgi:hypothetical protein